MVPIRAAKARAIELAACAWPRGGIDGTRAVPIDRQSTRNDAMSKRLTAKTVIPPQISAFSR